MLFDGFLADRLVIAPRTGWVGGLLMLNIQKDNQYERENEEDRGKWHLLLHV
jgi:hypothetical protein